MAKDKSAPSIWGGIISLILFIIFLLFIAIVSIPTSFVEGYESLYTEYSTSVTIYNKLREASLLIVNSCQNPSSTECNSAISASGEAIPSQTISLPQKQTLSLWRQYASTVLVIVLGGLAFVLMVVQAYRFRNYIDGREKQFVREKQQAFESGRRDVTKSLALELVSDKDVIYELTVWLSQYRTGDAKIDQSARIHSQMLTRIAKQIHLSPIAKADDIVEFDPKQHNTFDRLKPSEKAVVIEPGWRVGQDVIKQPLVRRQ